MDVLTTDMTIVRDGAARRIVRSKVPRFCNYFPSSATRSFKRSLIRRSLARTARRRRSDVGLRGSGFLELRVLQAGGRIARLPGPHVFWRDHGENKSKQCDEQSAATAVRLKHRLPLPRVTPAAAARSAADVVWIDTSISPAQWFGGDPPQSASQITPMP